MEARFFASRHLLSVCLVHSQTGRTLLPGSPLTGITAREMELFRMGLDDFRKSKPRKTAWTGVQRHELRGVPQRSGDRRHQHHDGNPRPVIAMKNGTFTPLNGGTLVSAFLHPPHRCQVQIPAEANVIARRMPIPLFGAGLVEAIPDETIMALEDPDDRDGDGIRGRAARIKDVATGDTQIGRFGWKAQQATCWRSPATRIATRWGSPTTCFPTSLRPESIRSK